MIRVTRQADLGIVLLGLMASHARDRIFSARDLAKASFQPLPMVSKVLKALSRYGLLLSHRGVNGGYSLSRHPEEISAREIIAALDGPIALTSCLDDTTEACTAESLCPAASSFQRMNAAICEALDNVKLAEMVATPGASDSVTTED